MHGLGVNLGRNIHLSYEEEKANEKKVIREHLGLTTVVKSVYAYDENIWEFYCGGKGMLDVGMYRGFYYSKMDTPYAFEFRPVELTEIEPDTFEWHDEKGETKEHKGHSIYTKKIRDNWWYYEMNWY